MLFEALNADLEAVGPGVLGQPFLVETLKHACVMIEGFLCALGSKIELSNRR